MQVGILLHVLDFLEKKEQKVGNEGNIIIDTYRRVLNQTKPHQEFQGHIRYMYVGHIPRLPQTPEKALCNLQYEITFYI